MPVSRRRPATVQPAVPLSSSLPPGWMRIRPGLPELLEVAAGRFVMGNDFGSSEVQPAHYLTLESYQIARYPVTHLEYSAFVIEMQRPSPPRWPRPVRWLEEAALPVCVTWPEAMAYCAWLSKRMGVHVRLPSEAEWEKAASWNPEKELKTLYPWGNDFDPAYCNTVESHLEMPTPIDTYRPVGDSPYGVSDLIGNVAEWTLARKMPYPYSATAGRHDPNVVEARVARGGSFSSEGKRVTALFRMYLPPDERRQPVGFRIVVDH